MTSDITTIPEQEQRSLATRLTPAQMKADYDLVLQVMSAAMEKDKDYGVIPGTFKPTLYKPGAEKLMLVFKLAGKPAIKDLTTSDEIRYQVTTEIIHAPSGTVVGYGVGEASTNEGKYKWRKADKAEWDDTPEDRRRKKYGKEVVLQVRTEPADLANTVLKMADKRSLISGILKVTAASSVFSQDLEDMDKEIQEAVANAEEGTMPIKQPKRKSEAQTKGSEPTPGSPATPPNPPQGSTNAPKKAPDSFRAMNSKVDGGSCSTCSGKLALGDPIWFDTKARRAHCRSHFI